MAAQLQAPKINLETIIKPDSLIPSGLTSTIEDGITAVNRILYAPRQNSAVEAAVADIYDVTVGIIPFIGDAVANGPRTAIAKAQHDEEATFFHSIDLLLGIVPEFGDLLSAFVPANTILYARSKADCIGSAGPNPQKLNDCLFPNEGIEKTLLRRMRENSNR